MDTIVLPGNLINKLEKTLKEVGSLAREIEKHKSKMLKSQAWFWSKNWQKGEKKAQEDIELGRVKRFDNASDLIKDLRG